MIHKIHNCIQKDKQWIDTASKAFKMAQMRKFYEHEERKLKKELQLLSDNQNAYGGEFMLVKQERKGIVIYKDIPELRHVNLDEYRGDPVVSWRLTKI